jgi:hypothetical protein
MEKANMQNFIASIHDDYIDQISEIAEKLKDKGCEIDYILEISGVITGKADQKINLDDLYVDGITSIEKERILKKK